MLVNTVENRMESAKGREEDTEAEPRGLNDQNRKSAQMAKLNMKKQCNVL